MSVNEKVFGQAMKAALNGPEKKFVKFRNHDFHIRPIKKTSNGNGWCTSRATCSISWPCDPTTK